MAFVTTEERVDRLEAVFGQFMTEMAVLNRKADERNKAAEDRNRAAEERSKAADERMALLERDARAFREEVAVLNRKADERNKAAEDRNRAAEERSKAADERMALFEADSRAFKDEMRAFKDEMRAFKDEMRASKRDLDKKWGDLANKLGTILEDVVAPNLRRLAIEHFGFSNIEDFMLRRSRQHGGRTTEFDALVVGPAAVVLGEAKSSPSLDSAAEFAVKAALFFDFFPEYRGRRLIPILGSWSMPAAVIARLTALGIYALRMGEDTMELANAAALEGRGPGAGAAAATT